jgi:hypothetical protein
MTSPILTAYSLTIQQDCHSKITKPEETHENLGLILIKHMNSIAKITIPIEKLYQTINSAEVLSAQQTIHNATAITNSAEYSAAASAIAQVNTAVKAIENARKTVTTPLDSYKKELMRIESEATAPLVQFIASTKAAMLRYSEEAERKLAAEQSKAATLEDLVDVTIKQDHIKGIRTIRRAQINGEVDWLKVLSVLFGSGLYRPEDFTRNLLKAMEICKVDSIAGIEIFEEKIQTITR